MHGLRTRRFSLLFCLCLITTPALVRAQVDAPTSLDEVDPDAKSDREVEEDAVDEDDSRLRPRDPLLDLPVRSKKPAPAPTPTAPAQPRDDATTAAPDAEREVKPPPPSPPATTTTTTTPAPRPLPQPIAVPTTTDADLSRLWIDWRAADATGNAAAATQARAALLAARDELGITDLDAFAAAAARGARKKSEANDPVGGIELATAAVELAPNLPLARFALARAYFSSDPGDVGRWGRELKETATALWRDPRYLRPAMGDLFTALLAALVATAAAVIVILFLRRARYFFHDFHHLFPRAAARWQTAPLALVLLALPLVFRLGFVPVLLTLFLAMTLYLDLKERIVTVALISLIGVLPLGAAVIADSTAFAGTVAEDLTALERGSSDAAWAANRVKDRVAQGRAGYLELFALGRYQLRRGQLEAANETFKKAALENGNDARLLVNLGNARLGLGDLEGATTMYARAGEISPELAASFFNTARLHYRKAQTLSDAAEAAELEKAQSAQTIALQQDPSLAGQVDLPKDAPQPLNKLLVSPGLTWSEMRAHATLPGVSDRIAAQLAWRLMGMAPGALAYGLPFVIALALLGLGSLARSVGASHACDKCGRAVCRRCDPELGVFSGLCGQCVTVFTRKGLVAPQVKVRKQLEVDRYRTRGDRLSWLFGIICSGGGHLYKGATIKGALYAFLFLFLVFMAIFREGVVRAPFGDLPMLFRLVPAALLLVLVYLLSLRSLRKAQAG